MTIFFTLLQFISGLVFTVQQQQEEMAGSDIYVVLTVTLIIWLGLFGYLMFLDSKVKTLKEKIEAE